MVDSTTLYCTVHWRLPPTTTNDDDQRRRLFNTFQRHIYHIQHHITTHFALMYNIFKSYFTSLSLLLNNPGLPQKLTATDIATSTTIKLRIEYTHCILAEIHHLTVSYKLFCYYWYSLLTQFFVCGCLQLLLKQQQLLLLLLLHWTTFSNYHMLGWQRNLLNSGNT